MGLLSMLKKLKKSSKELRILLLGLDNAGAWGIRMRCYSHQRQQQQRMAAMQRTRRMRSERAFVVESTVAASPIVPRRAGCSCKRWLSGVVCALLCCVCGLVVVQARRLRSRS
jgi:predicted phage tail protein